MQRSKMTNKDVEKFPVTAEDKAKDHPVLWDGEVKGFGMRYSAKSGTRTYFLQFRVKGSKQERQLSIGRHNDPWRVEDARSKALLLKAQMLSGVDPVEEDQKKLKEVERQKALKTTLRQVMENYLANKRTKHGPLRPTTKQDIRRHVEKNLTTWLDEPVAGITRDMCLAKFTSISERAPQQANGMAVYLRALLNHAREMHATDDGDYPILAVNPVTRMFKLRKPNPEKAANTRIPLNKVGACWTWLRKRSADARTENERTAADWLSFIMLTGCRRLESGSLKWPDVDLEARTITLRSDVVKNHTQLVLPMSDAMHVLLTARRNPPAVPDRIARRRRVERRADEYVFASNGKKCPHITNAQATVEELSRIARAHVHVHALRRTFDDIAMECKIDGDLRRMLLNHINGDVHARHYSNGARALVGAVESIAQYVIDAGKVAEAQASGANVLSFPGKTG